MDQMSWRTPVRRWTGLLCSGHFCSFLALGVLSGGGGSQSGDGTAPNTTLPPSPEEASTVAVGVSGTEGTAYPRNLRPGTSLELTR